MGSGMKICNNIKWTGFFVMVLTVIIELLVFVISEYLIRKGKNLWKKIIKK